MKQYIDKSALVAEMNKLLDKGKYYNEYECAFRDGNNGVLYALKRKLDTLEVKEVDLEKEMTEEIDNYWFDNCDGFIQSINGEEMKIEDVKDIAKHFFELGLKVQKGE